MKRAALGFHMHSGWGVLVAVSGDANSVELLDRRRIVVADPKISGAIQPYHFAAQLEPPEQEKHLAHCAASSSRLAATEIAEVVKELNGRHCDVVRRGGRRRRIGVIVGFRRAAGHQHGEHHQCCEQRKGRARRVLFICHVACAARRITCHFLSAWHGCCSQKVVGR